MPTESTRDALPQPVEGKERRHHPRATADWPLQIALEDGVHEARLRDVSRSGVSFYLDRKVPEMALLKIELELPDSGKRVSGTGVVVRCRPIAPALEHFEVAVFLNEMGDEDRESLAHLVDEARV